ncbi:MAG: helix-turn-helix transcriptional regulator [bacterium]|nr:helix-turn-helix transcriptional regulator [bacterium]
MKDATGLLEKTNNYSAMVMGKAIRFQRGPVLYFYLLSLANFLLALTGYTRLLSSSLTITGVFVFANVFFFKGLTQPEMSSGKEYRATLPGREIAAGKPEDLQAETGQEYEKPANKYRKTKLTRDMQDRYLKKLLRYMKEEKPYLDPNLTINDVSGKISIPTYSLSQVINSSLGKNFFRFVNDYRINESKQLLKDKGNANRSILDLLYDCGFNSKSTFNKAFKNVTGMTPSQFRELA